VLWLQHGRHYTAGTGAMPPFSALTNRSVELPMP
jgi:hypothetical protein